MSTSTPPPDSDPTGSPPGQSTNPATGQTGQRPGMDAERAHIAELARATATGSPLDAPASEPSFADSVRAYFTRLRGGDIGALPALLGLIVLFILFAVLRPDTFPTAINIANLLVQASSIIVLAMGLTFVLLLGEIDLSAGVAGAAAASIMAILTNNHGWPWWAGILAALLAGLVFGLLIGLLVARVGIPSFVVTLAFFLGLQGVILKLIGEGGTVPVRNETIVKIANGNVPVVLGWVLAIVAAVVYGGLQLVRWAGQRRRGLSRDNLAMLLVRVGAVTVILLVVTAILSRNRARVVSIHLAGVPYSVPLIAVILVILTVVLGRTSYGRHVYAVGGNAEAARRAGISVRGIRVSVFMIGSTLAAMSGVIDASRLNSVAPSSGGGNTLLLGVGAAVIGGTSLFGGKGAVSNAVIGGLVIAIIANGLGLLGQPGWVNFVVTGLVLLVAAAVDAVSRRRRASAAI